MTTNNSDNLAMVLERINFLMQSQPAVLSAENNLANIELEESVELEKNAPLLTEVYEGDSEQLVAVLSRQGEVDAVLNEMRPLIHQEVASAVLQASDALTQSLINQLEHDLVHSLRHRLITD